MLQAIRSKVGSWVVKILFFLLILSFAVWGIGDLFRDAPPDDTVAQVGDTSIDVSRVETAFRNRLLEIRNSFGVNLDTRTAARIGILDETLDQVVNDTVLSLAGLELGLSVPDAMLIGLLRSQPAFLDQAGNFSPLRFQQALISAGLSEAAYLDSLRQSVARSQMLAPVAAGAAAPSSLVNDLFSFERERRDAEFMVFDAAAAGEIDEPADSVLRSFHTSNPSLFQAPEYRTLSAVILSADRLAADIVVSDTAIQDRYDQTIDSFTTSERRTFRQVVVDDEDTADTLAASLGAGASLEDALAEIGLDEPVTTFTDQSRDDIAFESVADGVFNSAAGEAGTPVQSPFGWHVFQVDAVTDGAVQPLTEVRDQVVRDIQQDRALDRLFQEANRLEDALAAGLSLDEAADETGLPVETVGPVDSGGRLQSGDPAPDMPGLQDIIQTGFGLDIGAVSRLEDLEDNVYYVVRADDRILPETRPFESVRDAVLEEWRSSERLRLTLERAEEARAAVASGPTTFSAVASRFDVAVETAEMLERSQPGNILGRAAVDEIFAAGHGDVLLVNDGGRSFVIRVTEIHGADPEEDAEAFAEIEERTKNQIASDLMSQFTMAWRDQFDLEINRDRLLTRVGLTEADLAEGDLEPGEEPGDMNGAGNVDELLEGALSP